MLQTDCLVIGSGLAGSIYAYTAVRNGLSCTIISGEPRPDECNTNYAQGGIVYVPEDDQGLMLADLEVATDGTVNPTAAETIVKKGAQVIREVLIDELRVPFDRDDAGELSMTREAVHSKPRIVYCKDHTGREILRSVHRGLHDLANSKRLTILKDAVAIDLLTLSHSSTSYTDKYLPLTCAGAYVLVDGEVEPILAKKTVLATGGLGQLYTNTTNFTGAYGHGIAMAYRIGARVMDMEYVQFHPTVFSKAGSNSFLISEAVRGEGGVLVDGDGHPFMDDYHPLKSLAPRDIIARSITTEMIKSGAGSVFIDVSSLDAGHVRKRFPTIHRRCLEAGVDMTREPIPVVPAAHYLCGGIYTNLAAQTNIENLRAIGETACTGLHGANRLASTSLLECAAMGTIAAESDVREIGIRQFYLPTVKPWESPGAAADDELISQDLTLIKNTMWNYVGLIRTTKRLERATKILSELKSEIDSFYADVRLSKSLLNLRNGIQTALLVVYAAYHNKTSRGCHYREESGDD